MTKSLLNKKSNLQLGRNIRTRNSTGVFGLKAGSLDNSPALELKQITHGRLTLNPMQKFRIKDEHQEQYRMRVRVNKTLLHLDCID